MSGFGPKNEREAEIFSATSLITRVQYEIEKAMKLRGLSQKNLADRLNVTPSRVNQMLNDNGNMTLRTLGRIAHVLALDFRFLQDGKSNRDAARENAVHPILLKQSHYTDNSVRQVMFMLRQRPGLQGLMPDAVNENGLGSFAAFSVKAVA